MAIAIAMCIVQALVNMNELDVTVNGWPGGCWDVCDGYKCSILFINAFS